MTLLMSLPSYFRIQSRNLYIWKRHNNKIRLRFVSIVNVRSVHLSEVSFSFITLVKKEKIY
jgi:hypothetical protein